MSSMKLKWDFFQDYIIPHPKVNYDISALSSLSSSHCVGLLCVYKCIGDHECSATQTLSPTKQLQYRDYTSE